MSMTDANDFLGLTLTDTARTWYDAGFCVIPAHEDGGKRPHMAWQQFQIQRPPWSQVEKWLASGRYDGIGCIMGTSSGHTEMVEIEGPRNTLPDKIDRIVQAALKLGDVAPDVVQRWLSGCVEFSAGGGLHGFIRLSDGEALGNTKLARNVDGTKVIAETRGEGGFVIVAPSPGRREHPAGSRYEFSPGAAPSKVAVLTSEERDILHLVIQVALEEHLDEAPKPAPSPAPTTVTVHTSLSPFDDYRRRVTWRDILEPAGWTWHHRDAERDYWTRPGKDARDGQSASTIEDGPMYVHSTSVTNLPQEVGLSKADVYAYLHHAGDRSAATRALREAGYGDADSHPELPAWVPPQAGESAVVDDATSSWVREHLPLLDWHALWETEEEEEWIVEPLLPARRLVAIYSVPKVGKSLLMLELAAGIATGKSLLGAPAREPRRVLYVDFENDPRGDIRTRLDDMGYTPDELGDLCYLTYPNLRPLDTEAGGQEVVAAAIEYGCEVVVIDTVSRAVAGDENENDTWLAFYRHTGLKLKRAGIALVRLDHAGKDESKGQRGGSAKSGDVDAVWRMSRVSDDLYQLTCEAQRFPIAESSLTIRRKADPLRHDAVADGVRKARDELLAAMEAKGVEKRSEATVKEARALVKAAGITFTNSHLNRDLWEHYCARLSAFQGSK